MARRTKVSRRPTIGNTRMAGEPSGQPVKAVGTWRELLQRRELIVTLVGILRWLLEARRS